MPKNNISFYDYELPPHLIADTPSIRGNSRMAVFNKSTNEILHKNFTDLPDLLPENALLIANNSRVLPARLIGKRPMTKHGGGGKIECLLLTPLPLIEQNKKIENGNFIAEVEALIKPVKNIKLNEVYNFDNVSVMVKEKREFGNCIANIIWQGDLQKIIEAQGLLPLPPYMRREAELSDYERYQTSYAKENKTGSIAAPTAGLHFTNEMREKLQSKFGWLELSLHVGYGTFSPVRAENIDEHVMHSEFVELDEQTAMQINEAKKQGRKIISVGTTTTRALEAIANMHDGKLVAYKGFVNIFIKPPYEFKVIDGLITNFHLPKSSLLIMVSALAGRENIFEIYRQAIEREYRFFSYGDAMLLA